MSWFFLLVALVFVVVGAGCLFLVVIGLPGTWLMLALAVFIEALDFTYLPAGETQTFSVWVLGTALLVAILGEVLEFAASAAGAKHGGASRRGMIGSIVGAMLGGLIGTFVIPIPIVGSLLGAVLGAAGGAMFGELTGPNVKFKDTLKPAQGAAIGRFVGTLGKLPCAVIVWILLSVAALWP